MSNSTCTKHDWKCETGKPFRCSLCGEERTILMPSDFSATDENEAREAGIRFFEEYHRSQVEKCFTFHSPTPDQQERMAQLRAKGKELSLLILELTPESREQSLALTAADEATTWAIKAIARHE